MCQRVMLPGIGDSRSRPCPIREGVSDPYWRHLACTTGDLVSAWREPQPAGLMLGICDVSGIVDGADRLVGARALFPDHGVIADLFPSGESVSVWEMRLYRVTRSGDEAMFRLAAGVMMAAGPPEPVLCSVLDARHPVGSRIPDSWAFLAQVSNVVRQLFPAPRSHARVHPRVS